MDEATDRLRGIRVLIVEDTWAVADALRSLLAEADMLVVGPVANAADAQRLLSEQALQLAVVDVNLKEGSAVGLINRLSESGVSVVAISGLPAHALPSAGFAAILQKPFSGPELLATLRDVLASRSPD